MRSIAFPGSPLFFVPYPKGIIVDVGGGFIAHLSQDGISLSIRVCICCFSFSILAWIFWLNNSFIF